MSTTETKTTKCDECGKIYEESRNSLEYSTLDPHDPWLHVRVAGGWMTSYGTSVKTDRDACSPDCAIKMLKAVITKLERAKVLEDRIG